MPCPHFKVTITKRSDNRSAVAGAAYQSGENIHSDYDDKMKRYKYKAPEVLHKEIMLPEHAPPEYADRATLWNAVEAVENQWNSQLARRFVLCFPVEVPPEQHLQMLRESMIFGEEPENLLNEKMDMEAMEKPMFCLTNKAKMNGASLLLQEDIRKQIGECLGSDYFVIPSSIHEVLILPDNGIFQVPELNAMVKEVNETQVEREEQLSDKVQFCDGKTAVMENAERREARLEKAKEAEKTVVKKEAIGGIHGKLEKAKAEIKAKEAEKVPKNKSKDLATAL